MYYDSAFSKYFPHFSILIGILLAAAVWEKKIRYRKLCCVYQGTPYAYRGPIAPWVLVFGYLALLSGMRSGMNDTSVYISSFLNAPSSWDAFVSSLRGDIRYSGTNAIAVLFKMLVSSDYHIWFLAWAVIESCLFVNVLRRESVSFQDACFFFFTSTLYYNYFSMMRQWMAVAILFWGSRYLRDDKMIKYFIVIIVASIFHTSALIMIPVYFLVRGEAWSGKQMLMIAAFSLMMLFLNPVLSSLEAATEGTTYDYVFSTMNSDSGSSIVRAFIAAVPVILAYMNRSRLDSPMMNICVNMSVINLLLNILASATSGLYIIRLSTYLDVYNAILYPYLLNIACGKDKSLVKPGFYVAYLAFYVYQMSHGGMWGYKSDVLTWLTNY